LQPRSIILLRRSSTYRRSRKARPWSKGNCAIAQFPSRRRGFRSGVPLGRHLVFVPQKDWRMLDNALHPAPHGRKGWRPKGTPLRRQCQNPHPSLLRVGVLHACAKAKNPLRSSAETTGRHSIVDLMNDCTEQEASSCLLQYVPLVGSMVVETLCSAIRARHLVSFYYGGDATPGLRIVEPHVVARNSAEHLTLSAWFLSGSSESQSGAGWRDYLVSAISQVTELEEQFDGPRPGYRPGGGKSFHNVVCEL
jgi:hypothetical protein